MTDDEQRKKRPPTPPPAGGKAVTGVPNYPEMTREQINEAMAERAPGHE